MNTMNKLAMINAVFLDIKKNLKGLANVDLVFKCQLGEGCETYLSHFDKRDWFTGMSTPGSPSVNHFVFMNDEKVNDIKIEGLVAILCHELGHILHGELPPENPTLEQIVAYEKAANDIGIQLFSNYFDKSYYWNNHEDEARMEVSHQVYLTKELNQDTTGLPAMWMETHEPA